jgi:RNA polymerase sigma factor (sigma-70 family)
MESIPDNEIMEGLAANDEKIYTYLLRIYGSQLCALVERHDFPREDGEDLFQDTMEAILKGPRDQDFKLKYKFRNLFFRIAYNILVDKIRRLKLEQEYLASLHLENPEAEAGERMDWEKYKQVYNESFGKLNELCREIVKMHFQNIQLDIIAERLNKKHSYIRKRKVFCLGQLVDNIKMHPIYREHNKVA